MKKQFILISLFVSILSSLLSCSKKENKNLPEAYTKCMTSADTYVKVKESEERMKIVLSKSSQYQFGNYEYFGRYEGYDIVFCKTGVKGEAPWKIGDYWFTWKNVFWLLTYHQETDSLEWLNFIYNDGKISDNSLEKIWTIYRNYFEYYYSNVDSWPSEALCDYYLEEERINYCDYISRINPVEED